MIEELFKINNFISMNMRNNLPQNCFPTTSSPEKPENRAGDTFPGFKSSFLQEPISSFYFTQFDSGLVMGFNQI
jgi:hypothetical protein